ncbi:Acyl-CoA N-acyltransferase with RING/FYVE/PHD-type zinc finger protein, partial [Prunus dulcis]
TKHVQLQEQKPKRHRQTQTHPTIQAARRIGEVESLDLSSPYHVFLCVTGDFASMEGTPKDTVSRYKIMNGRKSKQKLLVQEAVLSINVIELVIHQIISFMRSNVWIETNIDRHIGINVCCVLYNLGLCFSWIDFKGKNTAIQRRTMKSSLQHIYKNTWNKDGGDAICGNPTEKTS